MDDEFAKALDSLHNSIDQAVDHVALPGPIKTESWTVAEPPKVVPQGPNVTVFLLQIFFVLFLLGGLQQVYLLWQKQTTPTVVTVSPEPVAQVEEKNLLQEDALTQAELEYLLKVKTAAAREPDPEPESERERNYLPEPVPEKPKLGRPANSFPVDEVPWVEADAEQDAEKDFKDKYAKYR